jgi:hypothetical protein
MDGQQAVEGNRPRCRRSQSTLAKSIAAVHQEQQPLHQARHAGDPAMARFVGSKISGSEGRAKRNCLAKCQRKAFTRNRIKRAGCVSHQRNLAASHGRQFGGYGNRAALRPHRFCARKVPCKPRKQGWDIRDTRRFCFADKRYAHLLWPYRRDISLAVLVPEYFHEIGPWSYAKVLAQPDPSHAVPDRVQTGPLADAGMHSVSSDDPPAPHRSAAGVDPGSIQTIYPCLPARYDACILRSFRERLMQCGPADTETELMWKKRFGFELVIHETNAAKGKPTRGAELHANLTQCRDRIRHQTFTASLVDWRASSVRNNNLEAVPASRQRRSEPGRPAPDHKDVGLGGQVHIHHRSRIISEQKPGPIAKSTP